MYSPPVLKLNIDAPETFGNLAEKLEQSDRRLLAQHLMELVAIDAGTMNEWLGEAQGYLKRLDKKGETRNASMESAGNGDDTEPPSTDLVMSAVVQFSARATAQILGEPELARPSDDGEMGADGLAKWVSTQLRTVDTRWTTDTDPLTIHMAVTGLAWRKRAFDDYDKTFHSNFLAVDEVIVNANVRSINRAPRITHKFERYPYEIDRSIGRKHWIDYGPTYDHADPQAPKKFYEVDLWMDFDGDDIDEPWTITLATEDSPEVVRIRPRWSKKTIVNNSDVLFFKPIMRFFPYRFLPDPSGGFLPKGFGWLLSRVEKSADNILANIDSTAKNSAANGGVLGGGGIGIPDKIELQSNRINVIPTDGRPLNEMFVPFQPKTVDASMVSVLDKIITLGDRLAGTLNMLENAPASMTATMAKGIIDTGAQIQGAVHRRLVGSMTEEFRQFIMMADAYEMLPSGLSASGANNVAVTADPSLATDLQRSALAGVYMQLMTDPFTDWKEVRLRLYRILRLPNPDKLLGSGPSAPDLTPDERMTHVINASKAQTDRIKAVSQVALALSQSIKNLVDAQGGVVDVRAAMLQMAQLENVIQSLSNDNQDGGLSGVASPSGDTDASGAGQEAAGTGLAPVAGGGASAAADAGPGGGLA